MTQIKGYKFLALGFVIGIGAWISGLALGDSCAELLGFFDNYDTKTEASVDGTRDSDGTSITYDLTYHVITTIYPLLLKPPLKIGTLLCLPYRHYLVFLRLPQLAAPTLRHLAIAPLAYADGNTLYLALTFL